MYIYSYITLILTFSRSYLLQKCIVYDKMIHFPQKEKGVATIRNYDTIGIPFRNVKLGHVTFTFEPGNRHAVCWFCVLTWIIWFSSVYITHIMKRKFKQWWLTIWPISTKRTITSHLEHNSLTQKKIMTCNIGNPGLLGTGTNMWCGMYHVPNFSSLGHRPCELFS